MKRIALFLVLVFSLALVACSSGAKEVDDYIKLREEIILEMGKKIEANPTVAGVDEARKVYESKKDAMKTSCDAVSSQKLSSDQTTKFINSSATFQQMFELIESKIKDVDANLKFTALINDFNKTCK